MSYPMKPLSCDPARQWWELSASIFSVAKSRCAAYEGRAPEDQHRVREAGTSSKLAPSAGSRKARRRSSPIASASAEKEINAATGKLLWLRGDAAGTNLIRPLSHLDHGK